MKLVCFDLDGVLVDSTDWHYRSFNDAMREVVGAVIQPDEHIRTFNGLPTLKKIEMLIAQDRLPVGVTDRFVALKSQSFRNIILSELSPDLEKADLIQKLKRAFLKVVVVSNCNGKNTDILLSGLGLKNSVDLIISSDTVVAAKPSPEGYLRAMVHFGVIPADTIIVEDSPVGLKAARASGAHVIQVNNPEEVTWERLRHYL